jgi:hypothetical protein
MGEEICEYKHVIERENKEKKTVSSLYGIDQYE